MTMTMTTGDSFIDWIRGLYSPAEEIHVSDDTIEADGCPSSPQSSIEEFLEKLDSYPDNERERITTAINESTHIIHQIMNAKSSTFYYQKTKPYSSPYILVIHAHLLVTQLGLLISKIIEGTPPKNIFWVEKIVSQNEPANKLAKSLGITVISPEANGIVEENERKAIKECWEKVENIYNTLKGQAQGPKIALWCEGAALTGLMPKHLSSDSVSIQATANAQYHENLRGHKNVLYPCYSQAKEIIEERALAKKLLTEIVDELSKNPEIKEQLSYGIVGLGRVGRAFFLKLCQTLPEVEISIYDSNPSVISDLPEKFFEGKQSVTILGKTICLPEVRQHIINCCAKNVGDASRTKGTHIYVLSSYKEGSEERLLLITNNPLIGNISIQSYFQMNRIDETGIASMKIQPIRIQNNLLDLYWKANVMVCLTGNPEFGRTKVVTSAGEEMLFEQYLTNHVDNKQTYWFAGSSADFKYLVKRDLSGGNFPNAEIQREQANALDSFPNSGFAMNFNDKTRMTGISLPPPQTAVTRALAKKALGTAWRILSGLEIIDQNNGPCIGIESVEQYKILELYYARNNTPNDEQTCMALGGGRMRDALRKQRPFGGPVAAVFFTSVLMGEQRAITLTSDEERAVEDPLKLIILSAGNTPQNTKMICFTIIISIAMLCITYLAVNSSDILLSSDTLHSSVIPSSP